MRRPKRIFVVYDMDYSPVKIFCQTHKLIKGLVRLGHDTFVFNYAGTLKELSVFKSKKLCRFFYKSRVDKLLAKRIVDYEPDIVLVSFARALDADSIRAMRQAAPDAVFVGSDEDPWPKLQRNRIATAKELDIVTATNDGRWLQDYRDAGVPLCAFLPNACDPGVEHRYDVSEKWRSNILWIGKLHHHADKSDTFRQELVEKLSRRDDSVLYGCCGRPRIGGVDFLYAVSGARIGVSVNAYGPIRLGHSNRLIRFLACGTMVLSRRFAGADLLFKDGQHIRYFDQVDEFFELADWYLQHEQESKRIAAAGMERAHEEFNCEKIAGYLLDLADVGKYSAPWT
jgi:glycosyltransferase involved in cell wall biosynthesis